MIVYLSPHFTLGELCHSDRAVALGIDNAAPPAQVTNLARLATTLLEPVREQFGPWSVSSAYRSPALNGATPGASTTSAHPDGRAADGVPLARHTPADLVRVVDWVRHSTLPFDQVIYEAIPGRDYVSRWVHLGISATGHAPRWQALMTFDGKVYAPFDARRIDPVTGLRAA